MSRNFDKWRNVLGLPACTASIREYSAAVQAEAIIPEKKKKISASTDSARFTQVKTDTISGDTKAWLPTLRNFILDKKAAEVENILDKLEKKSKNFYESININFVNMLIDESFNVYPNDGQRLCDLWFSKLASWKVKPNALTFSLPILHSIKYISLFILAPKLFHLQKSTTN